VEEEEDDFVSHKQSNSELDEKDELLLL